ncbi:MAG: RNA methyltransferase [Pseudomonadota bacterium]
MDGSEPYWLYGIHAVRAALSNPKRRVHRMLCTRNALNRLDGVDLPEKLEEVDVRAINRLLGGDAVHQGMALWVEPLETATLDVAAKARVVLCLDHITDPHNVGAVLRSAVAFKADAVVTTRRHSASETGALAKAASGALDLIDIVPVTNLSRAVGELKNMGFATAALDSGAAEPIDGLAPGPRWAFVLGAEGKGVRQGVAAACGRTVRIEAPGALSSLNVSNAAAITLYEISRRLLAN